MREREREREIERERKRERERERNRSDIIPVRSARIRISTKTTKKFLPPYIFIFI